MAVYLVYVRLRPAKIIPVAPVEPLVFQTFTPSTLLPYNGIDKPQIYMGVRGKVFDVSPGKSFYGPGGPYHVFAGRDASRGLAKGDLDDSLIKSVDDKIDGLENLTKDEEEALQGWMDTFSGKYLEVGELVNEERFR